MVILRGASGIAGSERDSAPVDRRPAEYCSTQDVYGSLWRKYTAKRLWHLWLLAVSERWELDLSLSCREHFPSGSGQCVLVLCCGRVPLLVYEESTPCEAVGT